MTYEDTDDALRADLVHRLHEELHHAADNDHVLAASSQGVGPGEIVPAVRSSNIEAAIEGAYRAFPAGDPGPSEAWKALLNKRINERDTARADLAAARAELRARYSHPDCGFWWNGKDGLDVPLRDGEPVCPRCEVTSLRERLEKAETALRYISSPTMGLPPNTDACDYAMDGATEHNARYALQICIRTARAALSGDQESGS